MDETVKQGNATETQDNTEKTFTQSELNQILKERLDREKAKQGQDPRRSSQLHPSVPDQTSGLHNQWHPPLPDIQNSNIP